MRFSYSLRYFTLILLVFSLVTGVQAEENDSIPKPKKTGYLSSYWHNGVQLVTSPSRWKVDDWARFGGSLAISAVVVSMDEAISQPFFDWQTDFAQHFGDAGEVLGSGYFQFSITGLALGAGAVAHSKPLINFGLDNLQAQLFTSGITLLVKELTHRTRPEEGDGAYKWYGPFKGHGNESFFSGHTSLSFCTATMIYLHSHKKWWVGVMGYTIASGIGISRMQKQKHWASDVIVGAAVGTAVASFIYRQQQKRRENNQKLVVIP
jgi:membrane-associated phospholipid phosphatase